MFRKLISTLLISWLSRLTLVIFEKSYSLFYSWVCYKSTKIIQSLILLSILPFKRWQRWETSESWQPFQEKHKRNIPGTASHRTRAFLELARSISHRFLSRLKVVTKKLSHEFSRTKFRISGALSKLDEFFLNPQIRTLSGTVPGTSRNTEVEKQEQRGIVPRMIPILKWDPQSTSPITQLIQTQMRLLTEPTRRELIFRINDWEFILQIQLKCMQVFKMQTHFFKLFAGKVLFVNWCNDFRDHSIFVEWLS